MPSVASRAYSVYDAHGGACAYAVLVEAGERHQIGTTLYQVGECRLLLNGEMICNGSERLLHRCHLVARKMLGNAQHCILRTDAFGKRRRPLTSGGIDKLAVFGDELEFVSISG